MRIKWNKTSIRILCVFGTFLAMTISLGVFVSTSISRISKYSQLNGDLDDILIYADKSTIAMKELLINAYTDEEFVKTGTNESYVSCNLAIKKADSLLKSLRQHWFIDTRDKEKNVDELLTILDNYKKTHSQIASLFMQKGFKDLGLEGEMRRAIHIIENHPAVVNKEYLLMLRRHEKDFLLRKDMKYVEKFEKDEKKCRDYLTQLSLQTGAQDSLLQSLNIYKEVFGKIVEIEKVIGLTSSEGLRSTLSTEYDAFQKNLNKLSAEVKTEQSFATKYASIINLALLVIFSLMIGVAIFSIVYFISQVTKPIEKLNAAADEIARGHLSVNLEELKSKTLMKDIVLSFEKLIGKLRLTIRQIEDISSRRIKDLLVLNSDQDEIGQSLNKIIVQIDAFDREERIRKWNTEGIAKFSEIIRTNDQISLLCDACTSQLVKYLAANQAALYLVEKEGDEVVLRLASTYAYDRKKYIDKKIMKGEGLVGQCYLEGELIFLTDVPDEYLQITSGLGQANPKCIVIVPFKKTGEVEAVFEIASFTVFEPYQIEFLEKIGESIASTIYSVKVNENTKMLLEESRQQTEQMHSQEEEMRQNMEELSATQEEYKRSENDYIQKIKSLEKKLLSKIEKEVV